MFNTMMPFVLAAFVASAVHGLPIQDEIKNKLTAEHETVQGVIDIEDAFGNELRFHESDDELAFLENGVHEDMGDAYYTTALRVNHAMPAHDEIDTLPVLLLQNKVTPAEKGHYLVELKNLVSKACRRELEDHLDLDKTCSCLVVGRDLEIIDGFSFVSTRSCLDKCILNNDEILPCEDNTRSVKSLVVFVEENVKVKVDAQSTAPIWSLDRIDARSGQDGAAFDTAGLDGAGVDVFVVDTGIRTSHVDFGGRARDGFSAIQDGRGSVDCNGHGTHCAGTVGGKTYGVAKGVSLIAVRTLDCNGSGASSGVLRGYDWVLANKAPGRPAIISASLGGPYSQASKDAVRRITSAGVSMIVAAGNENTDACNGSPASEGGAGPAVTVAASDNRDRRASFSCYGRCADLFAPGVDIKSADEGSDTGTDTMSGTSMATPAVAGAAALYLSGRPDATPAEVKAALICKSTPAYCVSKMSVMRFASKEATDTYRENCLSSC
jgi:subtilisin family serine protease